jgi:hypothetical protein
MIKHGSSGRNPAQSAEFFAVELRETEIDVLVRKGLLDRGKRDDRSAIVQALHVYLERSLGRRS